MSPSELAAAHARLVDGAATLRLGRAQDLPFEDASIDVVLCHMAIMLMSPIEPVLAEIARVLKPGGRFAAVIGMWGAPEDADAACLQALRAALSEEHVASSMKGLGDLRFRSEEGLKGLFDATPDLQGTFQLMPIELELRCPVERMVSDYTLLYPIELLTEGAQDRLKQNYRDAVAPWVDESGRVLSRSRLALFSVERTTPVTATP